MNTKNEILNKVLIEVLGQRNNWTSEVKWYSEHSDTETYGALISQFSMYSTVYDQMAQYLFIALDDSVTDSPEDAQRVISALLEDVEEQKVSTKEQFEFIEPAVIDSMYELAVAKIKAIW